MDKKCKHCNATLQPCDSMGRIVGYRQVKVGKKKQLVYDDGLPVQYLVCPVALQEFLRDDHGFYYRRVGKTVHPQVEVEHPAGYFAERRRRSREQQVEALPVEEIETKLRTKKRAERSYVGGE